MLLEKKGDIYSIGRLPVGLLWLYNVKYKYTGYLILSQLNTNRLLWEFMDYGGGNFSSRLVVSAG